MCSMRLGNVSMQVGIEQLPQRNKCFSAVTSMLSARTWFKHVYVNFALWHFCWLSPVLLLERSVSGVLAGNHIAGSVLAFCLVFGLCEWPCVRTTH
jgi:hypothetical protein